MRDGASQIPNFAASHGVAAACRTDACVPDPAGLASSTQAGMEVVFGR